MKDFFALKPQLEGRLGITLLIHDAPQQFFVSTLIIYPHVETIIDQSVIMKESNIVLHHEFPCL